MERRWEIVINRGGEGGENERRRGHNKGSSHEIRENCLRVTSFRDTVFPSILFLPLSLSLYIYTHT